MTPSTDRRAHVLESFERGEPAVTIELAQAYLANEPGDRTIQLIFGNALRDVARYPEALAAYEHALGLSSREERATVWREIGGLYDQWGKPAEAERFYRSVIDARPSHVSAYVYLGGMLARLGMLAEAESIHRLGCACTEGEVSEAHYNLGLVLRARRDYDGALASFREALRLDPEYADAKDALGDVQRVLFEFPAPEA